jgi:gliding motility-associated-like protein
LTKRQFFLALKNIIERLKNLLFLVCIFITFLSVKISAQSVVKNGVTLVNSGGGATTCVANGYKMVGTAISNGGCASLTQGGFDAGGMWICDPINLNQSFKVYFQANFDVFNSGDGIAFVLQAEGVPNVLGGEGGGIGYSYGNLGGCLPAGNCIIDPSVIVEFDIWNNSADPWNTSLPALGNINDLSCDHAAILVDGNQTVAGTLAGPNCLVPPNGMVTDGQFHDVCIIWDVAILQYKVYFDSTLVTTYNGDIRTNFVNPAAVFWGFTAGSGGANQNQRVCNVDMITNVANLSCTCVIPAASYTPTPAEICSGATTNITLSSTVLGTNYSWNAAPNANVTGESITLQSTNSILETLTNLTAVPQIVNYMVVPSVIGCANGPTLNIPVTVYPTPVIAGTTTICENSTSQLTGSGVPHPLVPWVSSNAAIATVSNTGLITGVSPGTAIIAYFDANDCQDTALITIQAQDIASFTTTNYCVGSASPPANVTGTLGGTFSFNPVPLDGATLNASNGSISGGMGGTTYTLQYTTNGNCPANPTQTVTVHALPAVNAGNDFVVCAGNQTTLSASGAQSYVWTLGVVDGQAFVPSNTDTYTVTGTDNNGCVNSDAITVTVEPLPVVSFIVDDTMGCSPFIVTLTNTSVGNFTNCIWTLSNGSSQTGCGSVSMTITSTGWFDVTLLVTSNAGCSNSTSQQNAIYVEDVQADFTPSSFVLTESNGAIVFTNNSVGAISYFWNFNDNGATSTDVNPSYQFSGTQTEYIVELTAISPFGCTDSTWQAITLNEEPIFYVPNSFTPNDDEFNTIFQPIFTSGFDPNDFQLSIYDRWGGLVWTSNDANIGWDGSSNIGSHKLVQDGAYTWTIAFKNPKIDERIQLVGHVILVR